MTQKTKMLDMLKAYDEALERLLGNSKKISVERNIWMWFPQYSVPFLQENTSQYYQERSINHHRHIFYESQHVVTSGKITDMDELGQYIMGLISELPIREGYHMGSPMIDCCEVSLGTLKQRYNLTPLEDCTDPDYFREVDEEATIELIGSIYITLGEDFMTRMRGC